MDSSATASGRPGQATAASYAELLTGFRDRFEAELERWIGARRRALGAVLPAAVELVDGVGGLAAAGGKRLRPALVFYSFRACGGGTPGEAAAWPIALAAELLHTYLLLHDDIMDHAAVRRGRPAAHVGFGRLHHERGLAGDGDDFGRSAAILAGDLAHTWAMELFADGRRLAGPARGAELDRCFAALGEEVIAGQYQEVLLGLRREASEAELLEVLRLKSGRYTVERPIQLGAILAAAPPELRDRLGVYGRAVGEAFQLQDDLLGLFGDAGTTGKPVGGDLAEGKFTFLIFHALAAADTAATSAAARIRAALGRADLPAAEVAAVQELVRATGAVDRVRAMIDDRLATARAALAGLDLAADGEAFFGGLLDSLRERRR